MALLTQAERERRERERAARAAAKASRAGPGSTAVDVEAAPSRAVWRTSELPRPRSASAGVPFSEGLTSVLLGVVAYVPVALFSDYATWNYPVAALLVLGLSYALLSRKVVVGPRFVAIRKLGPFRLATAESVMSGALAQSQRGGVLKLSTGDGKVMRLRRAEYSRPEVNAALRAFVLETGRQYDAGVMQLLELPWREDFGHHRYLLDAVQ